VAERLKAAVCQTDRGPITFSQIAPDLAVPAKNLPIAILSRPVPIFRLSTRSLHNLVHQQDGLDCELPGNPSRCTVIAEALR